MIAALWANSNYDPQEEGAEAPRTAMVEEIEESYSKVIYKIVNDLPLKDPEAEEERPPDDPYGFFAAGRRGEAKIYAKLEEQNVGDTSVRDVIDINYKELDQG